MKYKKFAALAVTFASVALLAACGNSSSDKSSSDSSKTASTKYAYVYSTDPDSFDYNVTMRATNSDHTINFENGLLENDKYGELVGSLAKSWKVSDDGLTYTYKLRDADWTDSEGNVYGKITAQDFVTGLKHAADSKSEQMYVVQGSIKGLDDYVSGKTKNFDDVGVKAVDKKTVQYTLNQPESFWNSKTTYGILFPVNEKFLKQKGKDYGKATADSILYSGPYLLKNFTSKSVLEYTANPNYWDKKHVYIKDVKFTFYDGKNPDELYKKFEAGEYSNARVFPNLPGYDKIKKDSGKNIIYSMQTSMTYNMTFNLNRGAYNLTSKKTDKAKEDTKKAILNKNFRLAVQKSIDKNAYAAQSVGKDGSNKILRNSLTVPSFVNVNGHDYGTEVENQLKKLNSDLYSNVNLADAQDGTYNKQQAKELFKKAKEELEADGVAFPVHLDLPQPETSATLVNQSKSLKKSVESVLGKDNVVVDLQLTNNDEYQNVTYYATTGSASDFDISTATGWGPDYDDPSSYLEIYNPANGSQLTTLGLEATGEGQDISAAAKKAVGLDEYADLLKKANAITDDNNARYEAYAKAEAWLLDAGLQLPIQSTGGSPSVTKLVPHQGAFAYSGGYSSGSYKNLRLQDKPVTNKEFVKSRKAWLQKREEIAKKEESK